MKLRYVRNLGSVTVQNLKNFKIYIFSHYLNIIGQNNDKILSKFEPKYLD